MRKLGLNPSPLLPSHFQKPLHCFPLEGIPLGPFLNTTKSPAQRAGKPKKPSSFSLGKTFLHGTKTRPSPLNIEVCTHQREGDFGWEFPLWKEETRKHRGGFGFLCFLGTQRRQYDQRRAPFFVLGLAA